MTSPSTPSGPWDCEHATDADGHVELGLSFREIMHCLYDPHDSPETTDVVVDRFSDRLLGFTHDEAVSRHPMDPLP